MGYNTILPPRFWRVVSFIVLSLESMGTNKVSYDVIGDVHRPGLPVWIRQLAAAVVAATILSAPSHAAETTAHTITIADQLRSYRLFMPKDTSGALPAFILLHGGGSSAAGMEQYSGFDAFAEKNHIVAVYPDGIGHQWNDGRGKTSGQASVDDRSFIRALIASLVSSKTIDAQRVYVAGISNGGMMALAIACNLPDIVAAVGVVAASQPTDANCPAPRPCQ